MVAYVLVVFLKLWAHILLNLIYGNPRTQIGSGFPPESTYIWFWGVVWDSVDQRSLKLLLQNQAQSRNLRCNSHTLQCALMLCLLVLDWYWHLPMATLTFMTAYCFLFLFELTFFLFELFHETPGKLLNAF